jgi:ADP-heptose:LPS heptosyltransferase
MQSYFKLLFTLLEKSPFKLFKHSILGVKREGALGDVILTTRVIHELKKKFPEKKIWVQTAFKEVFYNNPDVEWVVEKEIEKHTSLIIDLNLSYEKEPTLHLVSSYAKEALGEEIENKAPLIFSSKKNLKRLIKILKRSLDVEKEPYIVMHQAVTWENRTWPKEYWDQITHYFLQKGFKIVIIGRKKDFSFLNHPKVINLLSVLNLLEIKELIKNSKLFIGPDSAMIHIAMSTSTPIVGLFTISDPALRTTREENVISLTPDSKCKFCLHRVKSIVTKLSCEYGTNHCVKEITPEKVLRASKELLNI